jgi:probable rRNA maturation factor
VKVSFVNRAGRAAAPSRFRGFLGRLAAFLDPPDGDLAILFCMDAEIVRLNREWRGKNRATDVLSFPGGGATSENRVHIGDIAISVETAVRQARRGGRTPAREIETLLAHGLLHLLGYDHEIDDGTMRRGRERGWGTKAPDPGEDRVERGPHDARSREPDDAVRGRG